MLELRNTTVEYGVSLTDAANAFANLKKDFAGFAGVATVTQDQLAKTTAQMDKLGVSTSDTIQIQSMLVKGFQMTGQQAGDFQKQLMATAKSIGLPMQKVVSEFANASNNLKAQGANMQKVFLDLQNQAKNTGIEFKRLQDITQKFDTFEGAADAAGQLNAILGGDYLNSIELLNADEGERVKIMQESLKASGKSFEAMSKQERMAAAQALGLENVTELQKLLNNETELGTVEALKKERVEKELAESTKNLGTLNEKLTAILGQLAIALTPVLDGLKGILTNIAELMSKYPGLATGLKIIIALVTLLYLAFSAFKAASTFAVGINAINTAFNGTAAATQAAGTATTTAGNSMSAAITQVGTAAQKSSSGLLALGATMLMIGGGILLATIGLAQLVLAFKELTGEKILGALGALIIVMGGFAIMINVLAGASLTAIGPMLALGAAMLLIGGGIFLAAAGLAMLVQSFSGLTDMTAPLKAVNAVMVGFSVMLITLSIAAGIAAPSIPVLQALAVAMLAIGAAVAIASAGIGYMAKSIGDMFTSISKVKSADITASFKAIFDSITDINIVKLSLFALAADDLSDSMSGLAKSLKLVVEEMKVLSTLNIPAFNAPNLSVAKVSPTPSPTISAAATAVGGAGSSSTNLVPVAIYIDGNKLGEIVDPRTKKIIDDKLRNINGRMVPVP
jgi:hypothetical protein